MKVCFQLLPQIQRLRSLQKTQSKGNLFATYDSYAYSVADVIIVDINLDVLKNSDFSKTLINYDVNLKPFKRVLKQLETIVKRTC